jgi:hypothetical protein
MARVIIVNDRPDAGGHVVLDEHIDSNRLSDEREAGQFVERLGWAINDVEEARGGEPHRRQPTRESAPGWGGSQAAPQVQPHPRVAVLLGREAA